MGVMETLSFAAILFLSSAPHTESLSIKRHAPRSSDADLTAALAVLQRHRRQTSDVDFLKSYLLENQDKIPPSFLDALNDNYGLLEKNQGKLPPSFLDALNDNYGLNLENYYSKKPESDNIVDRRMFLDAYGRNNYKDIGLFSPYESDKRNVKRSRTIPTKAELAEIFGDINRASERTHKRQISSKPSEYSVHESNFQKSKQNVAPSETKEMSDKGNDGEKNNKDSDMREPTPVSTDELKSVFGDDTENRQSTLSPSKAPSQTTAKESKEERSVPTEGERFEDLASIKAEKKKRVEKRDYDSEMELSQSVLDLTRTVAALRDEVARLKIAEALEDKENDLLASALKQATLGQLQGTEGSLKKEFLDIQNAIRVEQELQSIRGPENSDDSDETSEEEEGEEEIPLGEKRQTIPEEITPNESVDPGQWYENPVTDDRDEMDEEENEKAIGELVSSLSPSERQQLAQEYLGNSAYDEPSNENNCPGVNYLTSQCSVAKMAGLRIDEDAKNLCNRHELCYTCGGTLSFSQTTCDAGFRGDVIEMCGKDTECIENGAKFLWFLKSEHTYNYGYLDKCDSGCVSDFIKGL